MRRRRFLAGLLSGIVLVLVVRAAINETSVADWLVAPLLVADGDGAADALVVPGAGVVGGCVPNLNGVRRVLLAVRYWRAQHPGVTLMTGGTGTPGCHVSEAMRQFAVEVGMPAEQIRTETASRSTYENADYAAALLRGWGSRRVAIVTDRLHMRRAAGVFRRQGFDVVAVSVPIYEGHLDNVSMLYAGLREYVALAYYRLRGWLGADGAADGRGVVVRPGAAWRAAVRNPAGPLVLLGASYAEGWSVSRIAGVPVVNRGVAGQQAADLLARFDTDVIALQPRAVLIWGFINDISRATAGDVEAALAGIRRDYEAMLARAAQHGIPVILAREVTMRRPAGLINTIVGWRNALTGRPSFQDVVNTHVRSTNEWLASVAAARGVPLLDFQGVLSDADGRRRQPFAQPDGSHITPAGYDMLTSYAVPLIEAFLGQP